MYYYYRQPGKSLHPPLLKSLHSTHASRTSRPIFQTSRYKGPLVRYTPREPRASILTVLTWSIAYASTLWHGLYHLVCVRQHFWQAKKYNHSRNAGVRGSTRGGLATEYWRTQHFFHECFCSRCRNAGVRGSTRGGLATEYWRTQHFLHECFCSRCRNAGVRGSSG